MAQIRATCRIGPLPVGEFAMTDVVTIPATLPIPGMRTHMTAEAAVWQIEL